MRGEGDEAEHSGRVCDGARVCWWCGLSAGASVPASGLSVASAWISGHPPTLSPPHDQDQPWPLHHSMTRWCWVLSASVSTKCHFIGCKSCSPVKLIEIQWDTDNGQAILRLSFGPPEASITWVLDLEWTLWPSSSHLAAAQSEDICDVVDVYFLQWLPAATARKFKFNIKLHVWASHSSQVSKGATFLWLNHVTLWSSERVVATFAKHASSFHTMNYWKLWCEESHKISNI